MSGINVTFLLKRISSASGVVGPLAPSATSFALILDALVSVITSSRAARTRLSPKRSLDDPRFSVHGPDGAGSFSLAGRIHEPCHSPRVCLSVRCGYVSQGSNSIAHQR